MRVLIRLMDCIEEEKADEKSGEEIKRERMTDEKREKKREWIFLVRRHGTREIKKGERHSGREFTLKPFAIFIFFYGFPLQRRADRERVIWRRRTELLAHCHGTTNSLLFISTDAQPNPSSPTRKKKGRGKLYCSPENEAMLLLYDVADSLMTANQQHMDRSPLSNFPPSLSSFFSPSG